MQNGTQTLKQSDSYKGFTIETKSDSHCAMVYKSSELVKCIAGDVCANGSNNAFAKAMNWIDKQANPGN